MIDGLKDSQALDHPDLIMDISKKVRNGIAAEVMTFPGKDICPETIIAIESEAGANPCKPAIILYNRIHKTIRQAIVGVEFCYLPAKLFLSIRGEGKKDKHPAGQE